MASMKKTFAIFVALWVLLALFLVIVLWGAVWAGLALSVLWGWFVVPLFGLPPIALWQAYGLTLTLAALRVWGQERVVRDGKTAAWAMVVQPPVLCGLLLLVGWCVKALV